MNTSLEANMKKEQLVPYWHQSESAVKFNWTWSDLSHPAFFPAVFLYEILLFPLPPKRGTAHKTALRAYSQA